MTQVKSPLGQTGRYVQSCKYNREHSDSLLGAFLLMLGIGLAISLMTAL